MTILGLIMDCIKIIFKKTIKLLFVAQKVQRHILQIPGMYHISNKRSLAFALVFLEQLVIRKINRDLLVSSVLGNK